MRFPVVYITVFLGTLGCVDPYQPAYHHLDKLLIIQGRATDRAGDTEVSINESTLLLGSYVSRPISGAVAIIVDDQGGQTPLMEDPEFPGTYRAPEVFAGITGRSYQLEVTLSDGRRYASTPEQLPTGIPVDSLYVVFDPENRYNEQREEFTASHRILVDWRDPRDQVNFYQWRYRIFREEIVCTSCDGGVYRDGSCQDRDSIPADVRYDYLCNGPCWSITPVNTTNVFSDELVNGQTVRGKEAANILFESRKNLLVEINQYTITSGQYKFNRLLTELALESGGLNATLPGSIVGNISNVQDPEEIVIGFFGASARRDRRIFLRRTDTEGTPTGEGYTPKLEPPSPPENIPRAPCTESLYRTTQKPEGWR